MGFCDGKQGAYLQISGNGLNQTLITGGGSTEEKTTSTPEGLATWSVYVGSTLANGQFVESLRGRILKLHSQSFSIHYDSRFARWWISIDGGNSRNATWQSSRPNWITRVVFYSGSQPITTYTNRILSATGSELWKGSSTSGYYSVQEIECGCDNEDCQKGSFPSNFCCTNCAQQAGILSGILSALQG